MTLVPVEVAPWSKYLQDRPRSSEWQIKGDKESHYHLFAEQ